MKTPSQLSSDPVIPQPRLEISHIYKPPSFVHTTLRQAPCIWRFQGSTSTTFSGVLPSFLLQFSSILFIALPEFLIKITSYKTSRINRKIPHLLLLSNPCCCQRISLVIPTMISPHHITKTDSSIQDSNVSSLVESSLIFHAHLYLQSRGHRGRRVGLEQRHTHIIAIFLACQGAAALSSLERYIYFPGIDPHHGDGSTSRGTGNCKLCFEDRVEGLETFPFLGGGGGGFPRTCKKANDSHEEECEGFKSSTRIQC